MDSNDFLKKSRTVENENIRKINLYNNNHHLETVKETISENSCSIIESPIAIKDENNDKNNLDKNLKNNENEITISTEHLAIDKFKFGTESYLHNNTKKSSSDYKTDNY